MTIYTHSLHNGVILNLCDEGNKLYHEFVSACDCVNANPYSVPMKTFCTEAAQIYFSHRRGWKKHNGTWAQEPCYLCQVIEPIRRLQPA